MSTVRPLLHFGRFAFPKEGGILRVSSCLARGPHFRFAISVKTEHPRFGSSTENSPPSSIPLRGPPFEGLSTLGSTKCTQPLKGRFLLAPVSSGMALCRRLRSLEDRTHSALCEESLGFSDITKVVSAFGLLPWVQRVEPRFGGAHTKPFRT